MTADRLAQLIDDQDTETPAVGELAISTAQRRELKAAAHSLNPVVTIADNGPGIPKSELKQVFKRFYRVPGPLATRVKGTGLGLGSPTKIPAAKTDFIFAAVGEELGLLGATAVLVSFVLLIGAGLRVAIRTEREFEKLLAVGLTTILGMQSFIIVGGVLRVVPLTGITLPFVSYGGSSLLANYVLLALLIRLSDTGARRRGESPDPLSLGEWWDTYLLRRAERRQRKAAAR